MYKLRGYWKLKNKMMLKCETSSQAGQEQMFLITHWPALGLFVLFKRHKSKFILYEEKTKQNKPLHI